MFRAISKWVHSKRRGGSLPPYVLGTDEQLALLPDEATGVTMDEALQGIARLGENIRAAQERF